MAKVKVGVVGYGCIGQRLADGVALQEDMELVGVVDAAPTLAVRALKERGMPYKLFSAIPDKIAEIEGADIPVSGTMDDLLKEIDVVYLPIPPVIVGSTTTPHLQTRGPAYGIGVHRNEAFPVRDSAEPCTVFNTLGRSTVAMQDKDQCRRSVLPIQRRNMDAVRTCSPLMNQGSALCRALNGKGE